MKMNSEQKAALVKQMADLIDVADDVCYEFRRPPVDDSDPYESQSKPGPTVYMHLKLDMQPETEPARP